MDIVCLQGRTPPNIAGVGSTWEVVPRPRMQGTTLWRGRDPIQAVFSIMLDGHGERDASHPYGYSQESKIRELVIVARGGSEYKPGIIGIDGIPGLYADEWIIESLDFVNDSQIRRPGDMNRTRQEINLTVREWSPPEFKGIRKNALKKDKPAVVRIKTKKGDTPVKIARRYKTKWTALKKLNPKKIKKPYQKLKAGIWNLVPKPKAPKRNKPGKQGSGRRQGNKPNQRG